MTNRNLVLAVAALALCACSKPKDAEKKAEPTKLIEVVVAAQDIDPGTELTFDVISRRNIDSSLVTDNTVLPEMAADLMKRRPLIRFRRGDPILWSAMEAGEPTEGLSKRVGDKARGMWVEIDGPVKPSAYLRQGDLVDVFGTFRDPETNESVTVSLLQAVKVLASSPQDAPLARNAVALLLTADQARKVVLARDLGTLSIGVRGENDTVVDDDAKRATIKELIAPKKK